MQGEPSGTNSLHADSSQGSVGAMEIETTARRVIACGTRSMRSIFKCDMDGYDTGAWPAGYCSYVTAGWRLCSSNSIAGSMRGITSRMSSTWLWGFLEKSDPWKSNSNDSWYPAHERLFEANYVLIRNDVASSFRVRECMPGAGNALVASHR